MVTGDFGSAVGYDNTASNYLANAIGTSNVASGAQCHGDLCNEAIASYASAFGYGKVGGGACHRVWLIIISPVSPALSYENTVSTFGSAAVGSPHGDQ